MNGCDDAEVERLRAQVQRVKDLHSNVDGKCAHCVDAYGDSEDYPCATIEALAAPLAKDVPA